MLPSKMATAARMGLGAAWLGSSRNSMGVLIGLLL